MPVFNSLTVLGKIGDRVIQRVRCGLGNMPEDPNRCLQNRRYVPGTTSHTPAQQARRGIFAAGVQAWHGLSPQDKIFWKNLASKLNITPFNLFMSRWLKNH